MRLLGEELRRHKHDLGTLVSLENGKILAEGLGEVQEMIDIADFAVGQSRMLYGLTMHSERPQHRMSEQWHPLGVVGIISAFNFPVAVWSWNAFLGAICGNACVWKPSPKTPLTALAVQTLCNKVMQAQQAAADLPDVHRLRHRARARASWTTGASRSSRSPVRPRSAARVGERVAARLGKSLLELGGNNAVIVDETANLDLAVPAIVFGAVGTAGQRCTTHAARVRPQGDRSGTRAAPGARLQAGAHRRPARDRHAHGPADRRGGGRALYARHSRWPEAAGGELLTGGTGRSSGPGNFVEPAIVRARNDWPIVQTETFAPILYLIPVDSLAGGDRPAERVRTTDCPRRSFTDRLQNAETFLSAGGSDCGIANINLGTSGAEIGGAFGGEKDTGGGRESGSDAWKAYMRRQTNTVNWSRALPLAQGIEFKVAP